MYLSRLTLNAHHARSRSELELPYELHRTLCKAWGDRQAARILHRADQDKPGVVTVIVQSLTAPDWSRLEAPPDYLRNIDGPKHIGLQGLKRSQHLRFRLRCLPSKRVGAKCDKELGKRKALCAKDEIFAWLHRKAETSGFVIREAAFDRVCWYDSKGGMKDRPQFGIVFDGVLVVVNPDKLRQAVRSGIGTQKAFGFGLLSLAPVR